MAEPPAQEYRLTCFGRPLGPWHSSREDAQRYAVKRRLASFDADRRVTFLDVSAAIINRRAARADGTR